MIPPQLPISPHTGETYNPEWGYQLGRPRKPSLLDKIFRNKEQGPKQDHPATFEDSLYEYEEESED